MKNKQAFTLIELLVVVLIIGILAAVAVPQYQKAVAKSKYATLKSLVVSIAQAEEVYYLANGSYTNDADELGVSLPTPTATSGSVDDVISYSYPWGGCSIRYRTLVQCSASTAHLRYGIWFQHTNAGYKGKHVCEVDDNNAIAHQICKSESGLSTHTGGGISYGNYEYAW